MKFTSFFSKRMQKIFEVYLKDAMQMSEKHEVTSFFSMRVQKILEVYLKKYKNKNKKYIKLMNN